MSEVITTTANRVKAGGFWCEDATAITQAALTKDGLQWDEEIPVVWGFNALGLANTILSLGSVRPKFQARADRVVLGLMAYIHDAITHINDVNEFGLTFQSRASNLVNPDRAQSVRLAHAKYKAQHPANPAHKAMFEAMAILHSEGPNHIKCIHASKLYLFAVVKIYGEAGAADQRQKMIDFITKELNQ
jgi:hypothetical protein